MEKVRPHRSVSALKTYQRCPAQFGFKYVDGIPDRSGVAAVRGQGPHAAAAANYTFKKQSRRDLPLDAVLEVAADTVRAGFAGGLYLTPDERDVGVKVLRDRTVDTAVAMSRFYHLRVAPHVRPLYVEHTFKVTPPESVLPHDVVGRPDLITDAHHIVDFKTKEAEPRPGEEHHEQGLTMYALLYHAETAILAPKVALSFLVRRPSGVVSHHYRESTRTMDDLGGIVRAMQRADAGIKAGAFPPTNPDNWWCSEKWCSFWETCPFVAGRRQRARSAVTVEGPTERRINRPTGGTHDEQR